jgi:cell division protein FtsN
MQRQRFRRTPKSLSSSQVIVRFVIAGIALFALVFSALLVNHWYLTKHSKMPVKIVTSERPQAQPQSPSASELSPAPSVPPAEEKNETSLTFYDSLVHKQPADLTTPPESQSPFSVPTTTVSEEKGGYTVQVGSFQSLNCAQGIVESLKKKGYAPTLATVSLPNGKTWHRVRIGNCGSREEAEVLVQKIKEDGNFEPMIIAPVKPIKTP